MTPAEILSLGVVSALLLNWGPLLENIRFGQSNLFAVMLLTLAWRLAGSDVAGGSFFRRSVAAGVLVGLAGMIKLTPFLVLPFVLIAAQWGFLAGMAGGVLIGVALSGWELTLDFFLRVVPAVSHLSDLPASITASAILDRCLPVPIGKAAVGLAGLALFAGAWRFRTALSLRPLILLAACLPPLFAGLWYHHHVLSLLPLIVLLPNFLQHAVGRNARVRLGVMLLALLPGFHYWRPCRDALGLLESLGPFSSQEIFVLSQCVVFFLLLIDTIRSRDLHDRPC